MHTNQLIQNQQILARWVTDVDGPLDLAVSFWGEGALEELGLVKKRHTRVLLELTSGGTNPSVVKALKKLPHVKIRQLPKLHAKVYISERAVVIGSTNASANGLGAEGKETTRWHELALRTDDAAVVRDTKKWFDEKWAAGQPITAANLSKAENDWKERQKLRPKAVSDVKDIFAAAMKNPGEFRNRGIFVVVTSDDWDKKGYADAEDYEKKTGHEPLGWQGWTDIPRNATLICFTNYSGEGFKWDSPKICYSPGKLNQHKSLVLVSGTDLDNGFKSGTISEWSRALAVAKSTLPKRRWKAESGMCMDLGDFAAKFAAIGL